MSSDKRETNDPLGGGRIIAVIKAREPATPPIIPDPVELSLPLEELTAVCNTLVRIDLESQLAVTGIDYSDRTIRYEQILGFPVTVDIDPQNNLLAEFEIPPSADVNVPFIFTIIFDEGESYEARFEQIVNITPRTIVKNIQTVSAGGLRPSVDPQVVQSFKLTNGNCIYEPDSFSLIWNIDKEGLIRIEIDRLVVTQIGSVWGPDNDYTKDTRGFHPLVDGLKYRVLSYWQFGNSRFVVQEGIFSSAQDQQQRSLILNQAANDFMPTVRTVVTNVSSTVARISSIREEYTSDVSPLTPPISNSNQVLLVRVSAITEEYQDTVINSLQSINTTTANYQIEVTRLSGANIGN